MKDQNEIINTETDRMLAQDDMKEKRKLKSENELMQKKISELNSLCYGLDQEIESEKEKLHDLDNEITSKSQRFDIIMNKLKSLSENFGKESKKIIDEEKSKEMKLNLENIIHIKIPELENEYYNKSNNQENFCNLVYDHVAVEFKDKVNKQKFRISSNTNFINLKNAACAFYGIEKPSDYIITDEVDSIIIQNEMKINFYLKDYSIYSNNFKLISIDELKNKENLNIKQENKIMQDNKLIGVKGAVQVSANPKYDTTLGKTKAFFNEYSGMKNFLLLEKTDENSINKKDSNSFVQKLDTSIVMMIFLIMYFAITFLFIYQRVIKANYTKYEFLKVLYKIDEIKDNSSLFKFISNRVLLPYYKSLNYKNNPNMNNSDSYDEYNEDLIDMFGKLKIDDIITYDKDEKKKINRTAMDTYLFDNTENIIFFTFASNIRIIASKTIQKNCTIPKVVKDVNVNLITSDDNDNKLINSARFDKMNTHCYEIYYNKNTAEKSDLDLIFRLRNGTNIDNLQKNFDKKFYLNSQKSVSLDVNIYKLFFVKFFL
jgi:hypothetical protein